VTLTGGLTELCAEIRDLERRIRSVEQELERLAGEQPVVCRLRTIPGIGLLTATAFVAVIGDARRFRSGRHAASFLGLTPREYSSGERRQLGAISKRGDAYLRMLLIHGARAVLCHAKRRPARDRLRAWALRLELARGHNRAAVALANRLARIAWAVWARERDFEPRQITDAA
jgi:transposase